MYHRTYALKPRPVSLPFSSPAPAPQVTVIHTGLLWAPCLPSIEGRVIHTYKVELIKGRLLTGGQELKHRPGWVSECCSVPVLLMGGDYAVPGFSNPLLEKDIIHKRTQDKKTKQARVWVSDLPANQSRQVTLSLQSVVDFSSSPPGSVPSSVTLPLWIPVMIKTS